MPYLGTIGTGGAQQFDWALAWSRSVIAQVLLGEIVGLYASHGGYIYVK